MLTPIVTALVFGNCLACAWAFPYAAALTALQPLAREKSQTRVLTDIHSLPTRLVGRAEGIGRPNDVDRLRKDESYELPSAA